MISRDDIVYEARSWIGTKWMHQASVKLAGCDCIGLIRGVARAVGIVDPFATGDALKYFGYGRTPEPGLLLEACDRYLDRAPPGPLRLADILVMSFETDPQHFALVSNLEPLRMIHAYAQARKVAENGIDDLWRSRIVRVYSYRGIDG